MRPMSASLALAVSLLVAAPADGRPPPTSFASSASQALTTTYACTTLTNTSATDTRSQPIPRMAVFGQLNAEVTSIVTAVSIDWFITESSTGEESGWVTDEVNSGINDHDSDATGMVVSSLGREPYRQTARATDGSLTVCAKTNAGTATAVFRLHWVQRGATLDVGGNVIYIAAFEPTPVWRRDDEWLIAA